MEQLDSIPQQAPGKPAQPDSADLVVGVIAKLDPDGFASVCGALGALPESPRVAILHDSSAANAVPPASETSGNGASVFLVPSFSAASAPAGMPSMSAAYQSSFAASDKFGARACCVIASRLEGVPAHWINHMVYPLLQDQVDLVVPHYARHKWGGLLNSGIISPLLRSLYGKRIRNPMGPDLGVSRRLFQKMLAASSNAAAGGNVIHPPVSLAPAALCGNLRICEAHVGARIYPPTDWANMSSLLAQVLSPVFIDMERNAPCWQKIRGSAPVPAFGEPLPAASQDPRAASEDSRAVDTRHMVESFQLGNRDLQEIWGLVLPPATLFELRKLARLPLEQFRMPDPLWVRIVYDFALAHRLRTISRDHLLKSMTPLYLAWVASLAGDLEADGADALEQRIENLSLAYEAGKPYLVSRWRWPDRFNP